MDRATLVGLVVFLLGMATLAASMLMQHRARPAPTPVRPDGPARIVVSIPPLAWFVSELAKSGAPTGTVRTLLAPGVSEHGFELTGSMADDIINADLVVLVGFGLESQIETLMDVRPRPWRRVFRLEDVLKSTPGDLIESAHDHAHDHDHDHGHAHEHGAYDSHVWLDPQLMERVLTPLAGAVSQVPEGQTVPDAELNRVRDLCRAIDGEYRAAGAQWATRRIVTHHNAYSYLARRYGLEVAAVVRPIEVVEPTPGQIQEAVDAVRTHSIGAIFVEPQFSAQAATRIAELTGARILPIDPLGNGDWTALMRANLQSLNEGLSATRAPSESSP